MPTAHIHIHSIMLRNIDTELYTRYDSQVIHCIICSDTSRLTSSPSSSCTPRCLPNYPTRHYRLLSIREQWAQAKAMALKESEDACVRLRQQNTGEREQVGVKELGVHLRIIRG